MDNLHKEIIDHVIKNVRQDFDNMGIDEQVLIDLQELWEQKLAQATQSAIEAADQRASEAPSTATDDTDSSVFAYQTHLALSKGPGGPLGNGAGAASAASLASMASFTQLDLAEMKQPPFAASAAAVGKGESPPSKRLPNPNPNPKGITGQFDGTDHCSLPTTNALQEDDNELGSDLDDDSQASSNEAADAEDASSSWNHNYIICQYEKVTRTKNKWKCILKDGMLHIDGRDYAFHRANCDYEW
jgi:transcription initiation factor TFIIA large subunit